MEKKGKGKKKEQERRLEIESQKHSWLLVMRPKQKMKLNYIHFAGIYATSVANLIFSHFHANWQNKHSGSLRFRLPGKTLCLCALKEPKWRTACRLTPPTLCFLAICYPVSNLRGLFQLQRFLGSGFWVPESSVQTD